MEKGLTIGQLEIGQCHESKVTITEEMIERFAEASGDDNPIHLDEEYAKQSIFKARVAHGMLLGGVISGVLGTRFPGVGTIYLSQTLKFLKPAFIGDEIALRVTVMETIPEKNRVRMETVCINQNGDTVLSGEAVIMPPV
jgi:3-hydroxybutyryl-CoA dehydratase